MGDIVENIIKQGLANFSKGYDPGDEEIGLVLTAGEVASRQLIE